MTPLTPQERAELLQRPGVTPEDLDEYERLLVARFRQDPDQPWEPGPRLADLQRKIWGRAF